MAERDMPGISPVVSVMPRPVPPFRAGNDLRAAAGFPVMATGKISGSPWWQWLIGGGGSGWFKPGFS
jgi:hypothetical protein